MTRFRIIEALSRRGWLIPLSGVGAGVGLSFATVAIDRHQRAALLPTALVGTPSDAEQILATIAAAVVPLTTTVLTVTLVAIQLAMGQFSPRIVRALLDDRRDQAAIAVFGATFSFCLFSLRAVDTGTGAAVPGVTVATAFVLALASGAALFLFVNRAGHRLRVGGLVDLVGDQLRQELEKRYPAQTVPTPAKPSIVLADRSGNVIHVEEEQLVAVARRAGCTLELVPMMGDFVIKGAPLFRVLGDARGLDHRRLRRLVGLGDERTHSDDPAYGFRKLVDVAQRALGTAQNDATTAVQVINRLQDCLRQLAPRPFPSGEHVDENGELRLLVRMIDWDGYVRLAFDEIRLAAAGYPQATRRLRAALEDLRTVAPANRKPALERQLRLLERAVEQELDNVDDIRAALTPDAQGIGSGPDVATDGSPHTTRVADLAARKEA
jgi:uncharacterized membrane protein